MKKPNFFNLLKKRVFFVYLSDLIFFSLLLWFLIYARNRIFSYLVVLQQFIPKLSDIGSSLTIEDASSIANLDALLKVIEPILREANIFVYFVVPVFVFLLWVLFQGLSWNFLKENSFTKSMDIRLYPKFALLSLPFFVLLFYFFTGFLNQGDVSANLLRFIVFLLIFILVFYFTFVSYLVNKPKFFPEFFNLSIKKLKIFFPAFMLSLIILLLVLVLLFNAYIAAFAWVMPSFLSLVLLLFFIFIFSASKCLLVFLSE